MFFPGHLIWPEVIGFDILAIKFRLRVPDHDVSEREARGFRDLNLLHLLKSSLVLGAAS